MATRGAYAKGVAKREEILEAALAVVAEHGYRKASVRRSRMPPASAPRGCCTTFGSKEELFVAILRARDDRDEQEYSGEDASSAFLAVMRHNTSVPGLVQLYAQLAAEGGDPSHTPLTLLPRAHRAGRVLTPRPGRRGSEAGRCATTSTRLGGAHSARSWPMGSRPRGCSIRPSTWPPRSSSSSCCCVRP